MTWCLEKSKATKSLSLNILYKKLFVCISVYREHVGRLTIFVAENKKCVFWFADWFWKLIYYRGLA